MRPSKAPEVKYRRELNKLVNQLRNDIGTQVLPILKSFESDYVNDGYAQTLEEVFENLAKRYASIGILAKQVAGEFVNGSNNINKRKFYSAIEKTIGVDLGSVVQGEGLTDTLIASTRENVSLIKSIPDEYFKKIESVVFGGTIRGNRYSSMLKEIQNIGRVTTKRAKLIARDQTSKLNAALSQQRQQNLGVEEYVWRTSGDERVRDTHSKNNGKVFRWDTPPKITGHPGQDIQCRCVAQPIIKV